MSIMPRRSSNQDENEMAFGGLQELISRDEKREAAKTNGNGHAKNPHAQALGKLGGLKGGKARAEKLSDERKKEIAQQAAKARWAKKDQ
jgi:hypothetical protein